MSSSTVDAPRDQTAIVIDGGGLGERRPAPALEYIPLSSIPRSEHPDHRNFYYVLDQRQLIHEADHRLYIPIDPLIHSFFDIIMCGRGDLPDIEIIFQFISHLCVNDAHHAHVLMIRYQMSAFMTRTVYLLPKGFSQPGLSDDKVHSGMAKTPCPNGLYCLMVLGYHSPF